MTKVEERHRTEARELEKAYWDQNADEVVLYEIFATALAEAEARGAREERERSSDMRNLIEVFADAANGLDEYLKDERGVRLGDHHVVNAAISPGEIFPLCIMGELREAAAIRSREAS